MKFYHILYVLLLTAFPLLQAADTAEVLEPCFVADQVRILAISANEEVIAVAHKPQSPYKHPIGFTIYNLATGAKAFSYTSKPVPKQSEPSRILTERHQSMYGQPANRSLNSVGARIVAKLESMASSARNHKDACERQPYMQGLALSPDGNFVAAIEHCSKQEFPLFRIFRLEGGENVLTLSLECAPNSLIGPIDLRFIDNENLIFLCDLNRYCNRHLYHINTKTRKLSSSKLPHWCSLMSVHGNTIVLSYHHFSGLNHRALPLESKSIEFTGTQQFNIVYLPKQDREDISQCVFHPTDPNEFFVCHGVRPRAYERELCSFEIRKYTINEPTYEVLLNWTSSSEVLIFSHAFMPDARSIITNNCPGDGAIKIVELETGNILGTLPQSRNHAPCFLTTHGKFAYGIDRAGCNPRYRKYTFYNLSGIC